MVGSSVMDQTLVKGDRQVADDNKRRLSLLHSKFTMYES